MKHRVAPFPLRSSRRAALAWVTGTLCAGAWPSWAQAYPSRPIRLVVPFPPGGSVDVVGRSVAERMGRSLGQTMVVENRAGASGNLGSDTVAKSAPDGYTLLLGTDATFTINPHVFERMPFDPLNDLVPVAMLVRLVMALAVHPSVPARNMPEFLAYVRANPGKVSFGSPGNGTPHHLSGEMLKQSAGIDLVHAPYKGGAPAVTDAVGGHIQAVIGAWSVLQPHVQAGRLRALGITQGVRSSAANDVPAISESVPGFDVSSWLGLFAPKGTPADVLATLQAHVREALSSAEMQSALQAQGLDVITTPPADLRSQIEHESHRWATLLRSGAVKLQ